MRKLAFNFILILCFSSRLVAADWILKQIKVAPDSQQELVESILPVKIGEAFDDQLEGISKRLLIATDKFESISFESNMQEGILLVNVVPKEFIEQIDWRGDSVPDSANIQSVCISTNESSHLSNARTDKISECIVHRIQGFGYLDAAVHLQITDRHLQITVNRGARFRISKIEFSGREKVAALDLSDAIKNKAGGHFLLNELDEDTKRILKVYQGLGFYFAQVLKPSVDVDPNEKKISINWRIQEGYAMDIQFTGHRKSRESIYQLMERDQPFPKWFLDEILDDQRNSLIQDGYLASQVTLKKEIDSDGSERMEINSRRGRRFHLISPEWVGISSKAVVEKMYLAVPGLDPGSAFREEDVRRLLSEDFVKFAMSRGYLDARFKDVDFQINRDDAEAKPVIYFNEGERYFLEHVDFSGVPVEIKSSQEWKDFQDVIPVGEPFDFLAVDRSRLEVQRKLIAIGFLDAKVEQTYEKNHGRVFLKIKIFSGPRYKVQRVLIRGAFKTDYRVLRHEIVIAPGDYYEDEKIRDSVSQILRLSISRSVDIQPFEKDPVRGVVYALVEIVEAARFRIEVGPGYGTTDGIRGIFRATYANIGGRGRRVNLYAKGSRRIKDEADPTEEKFFNPETLPFVQRRVSIEYFEPSLFNLRLDGRLNFTHSKEEKNTYGEKNSFSAAVDYRLNRRWIFTTFYELAFSDPFNVLRDDRTTVADVQPKRFTNIGEIALIDFLDDSFSPTRGFRTRVEGDFYEARLGGEVNLWQATFKQEYFRPLYTFKKGRSIGFALSVNAGFTDGFGSTDTVPVEKRLRVGGESSVRGFEEGTVRPRLPNGNFQDGGNSFLSFMSEVNIPIYSSVDLLAFFDGGNAYIKNSDFKPWKLRYGVGPGLRINTAVGPLKIGYGFVLFPRPGEPLGTFYLGVGAI